MRNFRFVLGLVLCVTTLASAQLGDIARQLGLGSKLSDTKISSGLKQALQIGAEQSVKLTGRQNGYFGNPDIKILMPNNLRTLEKGLRMVGYGSEDRRLRAEHEPGGRGRCSRREEDIYRCHHRHDH